MTRATPDIRIIHEDNHLLVVEKPVNILSQADETGDMDMLTLLKEDLKRRYGKPGNVFLGLVHRLDRPVGGVMVFAKTSKAAARLSDQMRKREFRKIYLAVIRGLPDEVKGNLTHFVKKDTKTNVVKATRESDEEAKEVRLEYEVIGHTRQLSLVKINLITGKPHQIRVQFSTIGHPLYGDHKYGREQATPGEHLALWSHEIRLKHPTQSEEMVFKSTPAQVNPWKLFDIK